MQSTTCSRPISAAVPFSQLQIYLSSSLLLIFNPNINRTSDSQTWRFELKNTSICIQIARVNHFLLQQPPPNPKRKEKKVQGLENPDLVNRIKNQE